MKVTRRLQGADTVPERYRRVPEADPQGCALCANHACRERAALEAVYLYRVSECRMEDAPTPGA